ncbi:MAG: hypothetical protein K2R93_10970 [Gemmatimonadaceae bacterium]|nr:hypothetical protein [Gemmatimonadaceae bacterium]
MVRDEDVEQLLRQCHSEIPLDAMWTWGSNTILEAVRRVDVVTPDLARYVVSRGHSEHLLTRDDIPLESIDAVWALLMIDLPTLLGLVMRWFAAIGVLLQEPRWRARAERVLAPSFAAVRVGGALEQLPTGREREGLAAAVFIITDPAEPLHVRAELLREVEREQLGAPLTSLSLAEDVLRAAYRHDPFLHSERAEALLTHASVLADAAWCAELIPLASNYAVANLPVRALEVLPAPQNAELAKALLHEHVFPNADALREFAHHLWLTPSFLQPIVTRADVLRCIALVHDADIRAGLLRLVARIPGDDGL